MTLNVDDLINDILGSKSTKIKKMNKYSLPGRGRKQCPECKTYVGVRTQDCECGYKFNFNSSEDKPVASKYDDPPLTDDENRYIFAIGAGKGGRVVWTGAGESPAKLVGTDDKSVKQFCDDVVFSGMSDGKIYMPNAIRCWLRHTLGASSQSYKKAVAFVNEWYCAKIDSTKGVQV